MNVAEVLPDFAPAFPFDEFNAMQEQVLPTVLESDHNIVASAPTASGKTAIAELAICKALDSGGTAVFIAPMRALTNERERDWERFEDLGYSVYVVTGERDVNPRQAAHADILVMTPEKVDSATRKHDSDRYGFITDIDLCVIDEVHLLDSERRGSALEVTIARLRRLCDPRIVALSATMPNVDDVGKWLDVPTEAIFEFGEEYRPVELTAGVKTYTHGENSFADKYRRLYRALDLAEPHINEDGQALVFVSSRQDTKRAALKARDEIAERDIDMGARGDYDFHQEAQALEDDTLRQSVLDGVAFHHAGLSRNDRDLVESWFRAGHIQLLFSTSTLAWGVNLPARCVIIRDTKYHDPLEGQQEMSPLDTLQMLGRAGRPGYDDQGYGWVITDEADADRYRRLLSDGKEIQSQLGDAIDHHLLAEVSLGTITNHEDLIEWVQTTYWWVRAQKQDTSPDTETIEETVPETVSALAEEGFLEAYPDGRIEPTELGDLTSAFYLRLETARTLHGVLDGNTDEESILRAITKAAEFDDVRARSHEQDAIDSVLGSRGEDMKSGRRKVLAILTASLSGSLPGDLRSDGWIIKQNALRLLTALAAFADTFAPAEVANRCQRVRARLEHGVSASCVSLTAIDGVSAKRAIDLHREGFTRPSDVATAESDALESAGLSAAVADTICEAAHNLPNCTIVWESLPSAIEAGENAFGNVTVENEGGSVQAAVVLSVNDVEMTRETTFLRDSVSLPVPIHGGDAKELAITCHVIYPEFPVTPMESTREIDVL